MHLCCCYRASLALLVVLARQAVGWQAVVTTQHPGPSSDVRCLRWTDPRRHSRLRQCSLKSHQDVCVQTKSQWENVHKLNLDDDAVSYLQQRLQKQQSQKETGDSEPTEATEVVQVEGYLTSQRNFGNSFCFFDISRRGVQVPVQAMLKRQSFGDPSRFDGFMKSLVPGICLCIAGPVAPTRNPGEALILVQDINIQKLPHNPQHVRKLLKLINDGLLGAADLATAARMDSSTLLAAIQTATKDRDPSNPKVFSGLAKVILSDLEEEHENDAEYPYFSTAHKYTTSLPAAPPELCRPPPPPQLGPTEEHAAKDYKLEITEPLSVQAALREQEPFQNIGLDTTSTAKTIDLVGWVQNRRRFRGSITALELVDEMTPLGANPGPGSAKDEEQEDPHNLQLEALWDQRLKCVVHPEVLSCLNTTQADMYGQLLAPGSRVRLLGYVTSQSGDGSTHRVPALWIHSITLLHASWRPSAVHFLIEQAVEQNIRVAEAAQALKIPHQRMTNIVTLPDLTMRLWEAAEISQKLQQQSMDLSLHVDPEALEILKRFADLRAKHPIEVVDIVRPSLVRADFISTQGSRWKRKKEPQLDWMVQQIERVLQQRSPENACTSTEPIRILDIGGGKGYLANHLAKNLLGVGFDVRIQVLDVSESAINNGRARSERKNLSDVVQYEMANASTVNLSKYGKVDVVVALHACGALTDVALGHAVSQQAAFAICPCCYCSNPSLRVPQAQKSGSGTQNSLPVSDWLNVDSRWYDKIKSLAELQGDTNLANQAMHTICAMRLSAAERHSAIRMHLSLHAFPVAFSTRNFCLVGTSKQPES